MREIITSACYRNFSVSETSLTTNCLIYSNPETSPWKNIRHDNATNVHRETSTTNDSDFEIFALNNKTDSNLQNRVKYIHVSYKLKKL